LVRWWAPSRPGRAGDWPMSRLSPITVGLSVAVLGILAAGGFLMMARRQAGQPSAIAEGSEDPVMPAVPAAPSPSLPTVPPVATPPTTPPKRWVLPPADPAPLPAVEPAVAIDAASSAGDASPAGQALASQRAALTFNHNRRLGEADEQAFEALHLADGQRAAIRQINEEYRRRTEPASQPPGGGAEAVEISAALKARQDALRLLLGETPAQEFDVEERAAVRRLRGKYRFEWGRQLRQ
jgi:hypothetical protein